MVWELYNKIEIPIIGCGGIMDYKDAVEFMLCGASAIQVGTATFVNPAAPVEIIKGIGKYMKEKKMAGPGQLIGKIKVGSLWRL
ncbi:MAG: dihydroorotate dehydrogenase, partial [Candidatus Omnitrophica bacterium]|nr:dihydroorotate dehydrogenase [Candidatus Omnitrophota bacterium]